MNPTHPIDPDQPISGDSAERDEPQHPRESEPVKAAKLRAEWLPKSARLLDPETLAKVEPQARSAVEAAGPTTVSDVQRMLRASFGINAWVLDDMGFLIPETVWHPETVRIFVDQVNGHRSVDVRQELGRTLKAIGRAMNERFWPTETEKLTKTGPAVPYTTHVEEALRSAVLIRSEPGRADELGVTFLTLGGGLNGPAVRMASPHDMIDLGEGRIGIQVRGRHPRLVPIRADYTSLAIRAVQYADGDRFVTAQSSNAVYAASRRVMVHGFGCLELARARSTWLQAHLRAGTPLAALRVIAGPLSLYTLTELLDPAAQAFTPEAAAVEGLRA